MSVKKNTVRAVALLSMIVGGLVWATPATAAPGNPGKPGAPVVVFDENFENAPDTGRAESLIDYVSTSGQDYEADAAWSDRTRCTGFIVSSANAVQSGECNVDPAVAADSFNGLKALANVLAQVNGSSPQTNSAVAAYTSGTAFAGGLVELSTVGQVPLAQDSRFLSFSVNAAAVSCAVALDPLLRFYLRDAAGVETPVSAAAFDPCTDSRSAGYNDPNAGGAPGPTVDPAAVFRAGAFTADAPLLISGGSVGVVLRNESGDTAGNDAAFDDLQIRDVSPQLDKSFSPSTVPVGGTSTLTFTVTNTSELAEKNGWAFTDTLPDGLVLASPATLGGTCDATATVAAGGSTIQVTDGILAAGEESCTLTVPVVSTGWTQSASYENCAANISDVVAINLPDCAAVTFGDAPTPATNPPAATVPVKLAATGSTDAVGGGFLGAGILMLGFTILSIHARRRRV